MKSISTGTIFLHKITLYFFRLEESNVTHNIVKHLFSENLYLVVTPAVVKLLRIVDLEHAITLLTSFKFKNGIIIRSK